MDFAEARRVVAAFERHQVAYVVVGSMAMAAQGIVRATRDMDVIVAPDAPNVGPILTVVITANTKCGLDRCPVRNSSRF